MIKGYLISFAFLALIIVLIWSAMKAYKFFSLHFNETIRQEKLAKEEVDESISKLERLIKEAENTKK